MTNEQIDRAQTCLRAFQRMVRIHDWHWGYLDERWPDDAAVEEDLDMAFAALESWRK